jgi:hypothetical protein
MSPQLSRSSNFCEAISMILYHNRHIGSRSVDPSVRRSWVVRVRISSYPLSPCHLIQDADRLAPFWLSKVASKLP